MKEVKIKHNKFNIGDIVVIVKLLDDFTDKELIGKVSTVEEIDELPNGNFNYYVGGHYMHEEELRLLTIKK